LTERRQRRREQLHCNLYIASTALTPVIVCRTKNISSGGFYCLSNKSLNTGDWLNCSILFSDTAEGRNGFTLECTVEVLRVEPIKPGECFGLACRIEDYSIVPHPSDLSSIHVEFDDRIGVSSQISKE